MYLFYKFMKLVTFQKWPKTEHFPKKTRWSNKPAMWPVGPKIRLNLFVNPWSLACRQSCFSSIHEHPDKFLVKIQNECLKTYVKEFLDVSLKKTLEEFLMKYMNAWQYFGSNHCMIFCQNHQKAMQKTLEDFLQEILEKTQKKFLEIFLRKFPKKSLKKTEDECLNIQEGTHGRFFKGILVLLAFPRDISEVIHRRISEEILLENSLTNILNTV